jgi:hypothetical protein
VIDRDSIIEFIETRKNILVGAGAAFFLVLACVIGAMLIADGNDEKKKDAQASVRKGDAIAREDLFYPGNPLTVPGVQLFRERKPVWNVEDAKRWYTVPDDVSLKRLRAAGRSGIDALLESVP